MNMVQFNLLPDVKMTYVKAQRSQKLIISISVLASAAAIALFVIMFISVNVVQKKMMNDADKDITRLTGQLRAIPNVERALTVQSQLSALSTLHQNKHITSRLFNYLDQILPPNVTITQINLDMTTNTITLSGKADSQYSVNKFIDTLRYASYKIGNTLGPDKAFTNPTETSYSIATASVSYSLTAAFNPVLFANTTTNSDGDIVNPVIVVPDLTTTHSNLNDPANGLFNQGAR